MSTENKITVLGKTFNSEEERRNYYREELRKKLPELKKMEGFPIGEDEDILNLSDPPYYTACPNPWLNDFIAEWEGEKNELEKQGLRKADFGVTEPYAADISEGKNNPFYKAHSYHTKVPHPAIMRYILHYTQPGDIVFDGFAGTGMTGVASSMCDSPDLNLKYSIEKENKRVIWGRRRSIVGDLSPVASFIASTYNKTTDPFKFEKNVLNILKEIEKDCGWMYKTKHTDGSVCKINYTVWSDVYLCPSCSNEIVFWEQAVDNKTGEILQEFNCQACNSLVSKKTLSKQFVTFHDKYLNQSIKISEKRPVLINYSHSGRKYEKLPDKDDLEILDKLDDIAIPYWFPTDRIDKGDKTGEPTREGVLNIHHYYNNRSLYLLSSLKKKCDNSEFPNETWFLFEQWAIGFSYLNRYSPSHYSQNNRNLAGTLYIGSQKSEVSFYYAFGGKIKTLMKVFNSIMEKNIVYTGSALSVELETNSIDYIFTDPPFGSNLMYSELNFIWESWLKVKTNNKTEAIQNKTSNKTINSYQKLMFLCFREFNRVLKPGRWMTVEFSNTSAAVWNSIQTSYKNWLYCGKCYFA